MRTRKQIVCTTLLLVAILLLATTASAAGPQTSYTAWEIPQQVRYPGQWSYPGGNMHLRGMVQVYQVVSDDPRIAGTNTIVANANWDENGLGPGWGTFRNDVEAGGYWEGTWTAEMTATGYTLRIVGWGGGALEGLMVRATEVNGYMQGVILEPGCN